MDNCNNVSDSFVLTSPECCPVTNPEDFGLLQRPFLLPCFLKRRDKEKSWLFTGFHAISSYPPRNEFKTQQQSSNFANFYLPQLPQPSKTWYWRMSEEVIEKILGLTEFNLLKHPSLHGFWIIICKSIPHKATITILSRWKPSSSNPKQVLVFFFKKGEVDYLFG